MNPKDIVEWEYMMQTHKNGYPIAFLDCPECGFVGPAWHKCGSGQTKKATERLDKQIEALRAENEKMQKDVEAHKGAVTKAQAATKYAESRGAAAEKRQLAAERHSAKLEKELRDLKEVMLKVLVQFAKGKGTGKVAEATVGELVSMHKVGEMIEEAAMLANSG